MEYHYVSKYTKDDFKNKLSELPSINFLMSYNNIKKNKDRWGIYLVDNNKIIGECCFLEKEEDNIKFSLIISVEIIKEYRGKRLCYELVKGAILKYEKRNKNNLLKVVIAGGFPILKCLIKVFKELNYQIKKYKSDKKENIQELNKINYKKAIEIEKKNYDLDIWQTLFFEK